MVVYPCAKINLGLNIVGCRKDGYHDIETVFYPIPLCDKLEIGIENECCETRNQCLLTVDGNKIDCKEQDNLVVKAYNLLAQSYDLPAVKANLHKVIPSQAGLGGGSSDATYMLRALNELCQLNIDNCQLAEYASRLGADCPFFVKAETAFATGIGEILSPIETTNLLKDHYLVIVKPNVSVSTKEAYSMIVPRHPDVCCKDVLSMPIASWQEKLSNDFELPVFSKHPILRTIKQQLYDLGAVYAQMSGSGSAMFGIFERQPNKIKETFHDNFCVVIKL